MARTFKRKTFKRRGTRKGRSRKRARSRKVTRKSRKRSMGKRPPGKIPRTFGSFKTPILQSRNAARKNRVCLAAKWEYPRTIAMGTTSNLNCIFFCNNNVFPLSWTSTGDNLVGLDTAGVTYNTSNTPRGLTEKVYNFFYYAQVVASALRVKIARTGSPLALDDGMFEWALTPMTSSEIAGVMTPTTLPPSSSTVWTGANNALKWKACRQHPGTITGRLCNLASQDRVVHLHHRHNQSYFNTEPLWQAQPQLWCSNNGATIALTGTFPNWYCLTVYESIASTTGTQLEISTTIDQRWYLRCWDPVPAQLIALREKEIEEKCPAPTKPLAETDPAQDFVRLAMDCKDSERPSSTPSPSLVHAVPVPRSAAIKAHCEALRR